MGKVVSLCRRQQLKLYTASAVPKLQYSGAERCSPNMAMCGATGACLLCCFICGLADFLALCVGRRQGLPLLPPPSPESWFLVNYNCPDQHAESAAWHFRHFFYAQTLEKNYSLALCALANPFWLSGGAWKTRQSLCVFHSQSARCDYQLCGTFSALKLIKRGDVPAALFFDREAVNSPLRK